MRHSVGALSCVFVSEVTEKAKIAYRCSVTPLKRTRKLGQKKQLNALLFAQTLSRKSICVLKRNLTTFEITRHGTRPSHFTAAQQNFKSGEISRNVAEEI